MKNFFANVKAQPKKYIVRTALVLAAVAGITLAVVAVRNSDALGELEVDLPDVGE